MISILKNRSNFPIHCRKSALLPTKKKTIGENRIGKLHFPEFIFIFVFFLTVFPKMTIKKMQMKKEKMSRKLNQSISSASSVYKPGYRLKYRSMPNHHKQRPWFYLLNFKVHFIKIRSSYQIWKSFPRTGNTRCRQLHLASCLSHRNHIDIENGWDNRINTTERAWLSDSLSIISILIYENCEK